VYSWMCIAWESSGGRRELLYFGKPNVDNYFLSLIPSYGNAGGFQGYCR
jgi:hypothetical protein